MGFGLALALLFAIPAHADRALLIGVGAYPDLPADLRLQAPEEDARRLAAALRTAGFASDRITLMTATDGTPPTRAAVLAALDGLAKDATPGEQLLVYFSGHGAQAPTATPALEPDGLDELYLMLDARGWDGGRGLVPGAILDKELSGKLAAIRAKGADVWLVVDACHAGGAFRGGGDRRTKAVTPASLGIPDRVRARPVSFPPEPTGSGRLAAFFAAAPGALAVERRLPPGSADARPLSQFSYALTRAIAAGRLRSLRDLATAVEAGDGALGGDAPDPSFEGALDMAVLGLAPDRPRRFGLARDTLTFAGGVEEGFAPGDRVRLVAGGAVVGQAMIAEAGLGASRIAAVTLPPGAIEVERTLDAISGAAGAGALLAAIAPLSARGAAVMLEVSAEVWRPGAARACPALPEGSPSGATPASLLALPPLRQCDVLVARIVNRGREAIDVSPLYLEANGRLTGLGFVGGGSARLGPGEARRIAIRARTVGRTGQPMPTGTERLAIVALPATTRTPRDLRGAASGVWRSGGTVPLDAGAGALVYRWRVVGREKAVQRRR